MHRTSNKSMSYSVNDVALCGSHLGVVRFVGSLHANDLVKAKQNSTNRDILEV